mmetsp:Transcript_3976/g.6259  ORF Transcript_3976/g.6259 Transcript_3976/m.6259 type:complete len:237 (+) Transcript_3976:823-1533(+)
MARNASRVTHDNLNIYPSCPHDSCQGIQVRIGPDHPWERSFRLRNCHGSNVLLRNANDCLCRIKHGNKCRITWAIFLKNSAISSHCDDGDIILRIWNGCSWSPQHSSGSLLYSVQWGEFRRAGFREFADSYTGRAWNIHGVGDSFINKSAPCRRLFPDNVPPLSICKTVAIFCHSSFHLQRDVIDGIVLQIVSVPKIMSSSPEIFPVHSNDFRVVPRDAFSPAPDPEFNLFTSVRG